MEDEFNGAPSLGPDLEDEFGKVVVSRDGDEIVVTRVPKRSDEEEHEALRFDPALRRLRIFPKRYRRGQLEDQFDRVSELQIEDSEWDAEFHSTESDQDGLLYANGLPRGFAATYRYGLGIRRDYDGLLEPIETHTSCDVVRFVVDGKEGVDDEDGKVFRMSLGRFSDYRAAVDRSRKRGQTAVRRVIEADGHNAVAGLLGLDPAEPKYTKQPVIRALTEEVATGYVTSAADRAQLVSAMASAAPEVAKESPQRLVKLRDDIELVSLEALIERFEADLSGSVAKNEAHWQKFFSVNQFALQLIFAAPTIVEREQAHIRAPGMDGRGARIADFLCVNPITQTVSVVEIKTPGSKLVHPDPYRGKETEAAVYAPDKALSGAIAQIQSQLASVPQSLAARLPAESSVDAWNELRGAVIAGRVSDLGPLERESFLRYRAGLSNITVLGYDEVLERLKALRTALRPATDFK